ncbi:MFS transporter [Sinirhodobacter sp. HNIBRBA609]|nr:MFS transporter [Sinirhodobacter sp. HNIBRBA609]
MLALLIAATVLAFSFVTLVSFDRAVAPELHQRTRLIGEIIRSKVEQSVASGIPIGSIAGLEGYLAGTIAQFPEVQRVSLETRRGETIAEAANEASLTLLSRTGLDVRLGVEATGFALPILVRNDMVGTVRVESSAQFAETKLRGVLLDVSVLAIALLLIGVELALAVVAASIWKPLRRIQGLLALQQAGDYSRAIRPTGIALFRRLARRLNAFSAAVTRQAADALPRLRYAEIIDIRFALFVFVAGTEVSASFLPVFARAEGRPEWLSANLAAALPLLFYLLAVMTLSPFGGRMAERFGARRLFVASALPAALSLLVMAVARDVFMIAVARAGVGISYALASIACQEYALRAERGAALSRTSGTFIAMIFGGTFCGSVLGGVMAQHFGYGFALTVGAALVLGAAMMGQLTMASDTPADTASVATAPGRREPLATLRYAALTVGIAIPLNLVTAVFVWFLAPMQLAALGADTSETARVVMLYYLAQILLGGTLSGLARGRWAAVTLGAMVTAAALVALSRDMGFVTMILATAGIGIGHALIRGPLLALITEIAQAAGLSLSGLRIAERLGALAGLALTTLAMRTLPTGSILEMLALLVVLGVVGAGGIAWAGREKGERRP